MSVALHPLSGLTAAAAVDAAAGRPRRVLVAPPCSTREIIEVLCTDTGLGAALEHIAAVVAAPIDTTLRSIGRRLRTGTAVEPAFGGTVLADIRACAPLNRRT